MATVEEDLVAKIKVLNETIWEDRARGPKLQGWLDNFADDKLGVPSERLHALHLLSQFMYFGSREMRALLKALYRDLFRYPIIARLRRENGDTTDSSFLKEGFSKELRRTRFLGMGNPSESGCHLLYYFRQENGLPKGLFINSHEIFKRYGQSAPVQVRDPDIDRYVFVDDFCGSGDQARGYSVDLLQDLKTAKPGAHVVYHVLFATATGLEDVRTQTGFDSVECLIELDESFKCFGGSSRYFVKRLKGIDRTFSETTCRNHGGRLYPFHPLGHRDGQLLIGFHHNTPDNTLPVFWHDEPSGPDWTPIFRRYPKNYGWSVK